MNNRSYYDSQAEVFTSREHRVYHRFLNEQTAEILAAWLPGGPILDAGCGTGHLSDRLSGAARTIYGLDLSSRMLRMGSNPRILQASIESIPFQDAYFSGAYAMRVFPHLRDPEAALSELARVVRPGGVIVLDVYNPLSLRTLIRHLALAFCGRTKTPLFTRYDSIRIIRSRLPDALHYREFKGLRVLTPAGALMDIPVIGSSLRYLERLCTGSVFDAFGGFLLVRLEKL